MAATHALTRFNVDTTISGTDHSQKFSPRLVVETAAAIYGFGIDSLEDLFYRKSSNNGRTWSAVVAIKAAAYARVSVWFDQWTPGDSGTVIHIWAMDEASDDVHYFSLDTASDTLGNAGTEIVVFAGVSTDTSNADLTGAKSRGGKLYCVFQLDSAVEKGCYWSTDAGATWSARADPVEATGDFLLLFPGGGADADDMWLVYWDVSADEVSLKTYDASLDSWSEASISTGMAEATWSTSPSQWAGIINPTNNHLMLAAWSARNSATGDLLTWDINGAGSISAKTDILTDTKFGQGVALTRLGDGTIRAGYLYSPAGAFTSLELYAKNSADGMTTWGTEFAVTEDQPRTFFGLASALSSPSGLCPTLLSEEYVSTYFYIHSTYSIRKSPRPTAAIGI